jgi:hypothetical protein
MTGKFLQLLMAASALVPATMMASAASAQQVEQDRGDRGDRGRNGGQRQERGDRQQGQQQRPQRADMANSPQQQGRGPDRVQAIGGDRAQADNRQFNGQRPNGGGNDRGNNQGRPGFQADLQPDRGNQQADRGQYGRNDGRPGYDNRQGYRDDNRGRDDRGRDGYQNRQPNRGGYGNAQGYGRGNDGRYNQGGYNQGGAWNRGWRNDNRYAWSNYRSSNRGAYRLPRYYAPSGWGSGYRRFGVGFSLSSILYNQNYWIQDPYTYRLPEAYGPYRWVRYYNDALLVDLDSGRVVDTVYDIFW